MFKNLPAAKYGLLQVGKEDSNGNPSLYIDGNILFRSFIHARSSLERRVSGVFLGQILSWKQVHYLDVGSTMEAQLPGKLDLVEELIEAREEKLLGWYYSQPEKGILVTPELLAIAQEHFNKYHHFLMVIDPVLRKYGIFQWQQETMVLIPGFKATCPPDKKEQLKQLLYQTGFHYAQEEQVKGPNIYPPNFIQAYKPRKIEEIEAQLKQEAEEEVKSSYLLNRLTDYREVFTAKDVLVRKELKSKEEIEQIIQKIVEDLHRLSTNALVKLYWEAKPGEDQYYADHWICEIRWLGKKAKHSVIWSQDFS